MAEQRVTDELTAWELAAGYSDVARPAHTLSLIADLRASRAREAILQRDRDLYFEQAVAIRAERDVLQQRIDKALAWCEKVNPYPHLNGDGFAELRAVLAGAEADHV